MRFGKRQACDSFIVFSFLFWFSLSLFVLFFRASSLFKQLSCYHHNLYASVTVAGTTPEIVIAGCPQLQSGKALTEKSFSQVAEWDGSS
jgi:hypothetical protein